MRSGRPRSGCRLTARETFPRSSASFAAIKFRLTSSSLRIPDETVLNVANDRAHLFLRYDRLRNLDDIQGIITSGYRHLPLAAYLFVTMTDPAGARRWLARVSGSITSSRRWPGWPRLGEESNRASRSISVSPRRDSGRAAFPPALCAPFPPSFRTASRRPSGLAFSATAAKSASGILGTGWSWHSSPVMRCCCSLQQTRRRSRKSAARSALFSNHLMASLKYRAPCSVATGQRPPRSPSVSTTASRNRRSPVLVPMACRPVSSSSGTRITTG